MRQWLSRSYRRTARVTASAREIPGVRVCSASMSRSTWRRCQNRCGGVAFPPGVLPHSGRPPTTPRAPQSRQARARPQSPHPTVSSRQVPGVTTSPYGGLDAIPSAQTGSVPTTAAPQVRSRELMPGGGALMRWCVARGGGPARGAGRRCRPRGAANGLAPPAPAAPDRRRVGRRPRAVPARG